MTVSLLAWRNLAKNATITSLSAASNMSATNVAGDSGSASTAWQTVFGVLTSAGGAVLTIVPANTGNSWDVIGLFRTNLTSSATVTATLYLNSGASVWTKTLSGPVAGYGQVIFSVSPTVIADWCQITFNDPSCPDGFLNIPLVFCGAAWYPLGNAGLASTIGRDASTAEATSRGGSEFPTFYYQRRSWNITLDAMRVSESWASADPMLLYAAAGSNLLFIPDITSSYLQQEPVFGRMKQTAQISYPYGGSDRRKTAFTITERL